MENFPREFLPTKPHQTLKDVQIPIPVTTGQDLTSAPYTFEFQFNSVDSPYIDFSNSYLELWIEAQGPSAVNFPIAKQICNLYAIIDKITIDMLYVSPVGQDISVNYSESSIESSKARKFVCLKELSKDEINKSMYSSCECLYRTDLYTLRTMNAQSQAKTYQIFIPLMLITGLGTFDCAIKVKTLKMQFVTNYLKNLVSSDAANALNDYIKVFRLQKVYMNFRQIYDINFGMEEKALVKCIPNNCQITTYTTKLVDNNANPKNNYLVNRSVNFVPDYALLYMTYEEKSMIPITSEALTSVQFQIGGQNIYSKTDFPVHRIRTNNINGTDITIRTVPNTMFYNTWRCNSNLQTALDAEVWFEQPVYLFPISSVVDVNTRSGCEVNISLTLQYIGSAALSDSTKRTVWGHFIFVKFVRDGAMN